MKKRICDMTPVDKAEFLESTKRAMEREHGVPWSWMEKKIQTDIDATFDDEKFVKMDPVSGYNNVLPLVSLKFFQGAIN